MCKVKNVVVDDFEQIYEMIVTSVHKNQINFELKLLEIIHKEK